MYRIVEKYFPKLIKCLFNILQIFGKDGGFIKIDAYKNVFDF